jgi:hypothetical protein
MCPLSPGLRVNYSDFLRPFKPVNCISPLMSDSFLKRMQLQLYPWGAITLLDLMFLHRHELESTFRFFDEDKTNTVEPLEFSLGLQCLRKLHNLTYTNEHISLVTAAIVKYFTRRQQEKEGEDGGGNTDRIVTNINTPATTDTANSTPQENGATAAGVMTPEQKSQLLDLKSLRVDYAHVFQSFEVPRPVRPRPPTIRTAISN